MKGNFFDHTGSQATATGLFPGPVEIRIEAVDSSGRGGLATVVLNVIPTCFAEDFSLPDSSVDGCTMTVRVEKWEVRDGKLVGTMGAAEGWIWAGAPPAVGLADANYSVEYRFLDRSPPSDLGRHGGIMLCAATSTYRTDNVSSWSAPGPGTVSIAGYAGISPGFPAPCTGGVGWTIYQNEDAGTPLFAHAVGTVGRAGYAAFKIDGVAVGIGDAIRFRVASGEDGSCARGLLSARIAFTADTGQGPTVIPFIRGDANADDATDISDAIFVLSALFLGTEKVLCEQAADTNDDSAVDISDAVFLLRYLFLGGKEIPEPTAACGTDPTGNELPCESFSPCN